MPVGSEGQGVPEARGRESLRQPLDEMDAEGTETCIGAPASLSRATTATGSVELKMAATRKFAMRRDWESTSPHSAGMMYVVSRPTTATLKKTRRKARTKMEGSRRRNTNLRQWMSVCACALHMCHALGGVERCRLHIGVQCAAFAAKGGNVCPAPAWRAPGALLFY